MQGITTLRSAHILTTIRNGMHQSVSSVRVALVTASSTGLGAAIVKTLAPDYRVVINYFSRPDKAQSVLQAAERIVPNYQLDPDAPRFHVVQADTTSREDIEALVAETLKVMGRLDAVVSNCGWTRITEFSNLMEQVNEEDWDRCFAANVKSHLWLLYAAKPHLERSSSDDAQGVSGAFVTVASLAGVRPSGSSLPYSVTKAALIHLTKGLALICGRSVRCNSVSPGIMMTEWLVKRQICLLSPANLVHCRGNKFPRAKVAVIEDSAALKASASPKDVAQQIHALVMNKSVTGQNIVVDCGIAI